MDLRRDFHSDFNREQAFSRSIGLLTRSELELLKDKTVAIAGLGGVGGAHLVTLSRLGVGRFHIADLDSFELENFNRQAGASLPTIGREKVEVLSEMALAINPELKIRKFSQGVQSENVDEFLKGVDIYVDGLDFFAFRVREMLFAKCREYNIPAITAGPIGMGAALINFLPSGMSFADYFAWTAQDDDTTLAVKFLLGLTPKAHHRHYVVEPAAINLREKRGPSTPMACELCAGVVATQALKILLKRGQVLAAPHSVVYDAYLNFMAPSYLRWGNRGFFQRHKINLITKRLRKL